MSHLSTIISRVKHGSDDLNSPIFEQAVINLMEYMGENGDYSPDEKREAVELYDKYRPLIKGAGMPSHKKRLHEADMIRGRI